MHMQCFVSKKGPMFFDKLILSRKWYKACISFHQFHLSADPHKTIPKGLPALSLSEWGRPAHKDQDMGEPPQVLVLGSVEYSHK